MRYVIITGGEFNNKGAQAMSFITISRLREQYPDHKIIFSSPLDFRRSDREKSNYNFEIVDNMFGRRNFPFENIVRAILGKNKRTDPKRYKKMLSQTDFLFDISGYALSSQWGEKSSERFLSRFSTAESYGVKCAIMPQSIGPFDYPHDMTEKIFEALAKVAVIMPREAEGKNALESIGLRNNLFQSPDIVLTNKKAVDLRSIYIHPEKLREYTIPRKSVAIIPNMRNFNHGNKQEILDVYRSMIAQLRKQENHVFLIRHAGEDIAVCEMLKSMFKDDPKVALLTDELNPTEFQKLISQFDFAIASRFHSIVHAYKVGTPCIILGWAVKYIELAKLFDQQDYVFDVRGQIDVASVLTSVDLMSKSLSEERKAISDGLLKIRQRIDPFDIAFRELSL